MKRLKKNKVDLGLNLKLERIDAIDKEKEDYNFVGNLNNWTSIDEQKLKVKEIEDKTKGT